MAHAIGLWMKGFTIYGLRFARLAGIRLRFGDHSMRERGITCTPISEPPTGLFVRAKALDTRDSRTARRS